MVFLFSPASLYLSPRSLSYANVDATYWMIVKRIDTLYNAYQTRSNRFWKNTMRKSLYYFAIFAVCFFFCYIPIKSMCSIVYQPSSLSLTFYLGIIDVLTHSPFFLCLCNMQIRKKNIYANWRGKNKNKLGGRIQNFTCWQGGPR